MGITRIVASGVPGAESAALDAAIRFRVPYGGITNQGALLPGDRPAGRYRLEQRPYVDTLLVLKANIAQSDGLLTFFRGGVPDPIDRLLSSGPKRPCLHIEAASVESHEVPFRLDRFATDHAVAVLCVTGASLLEDRRIYPYVHDALTGFFLLTGAMPPSQPTLH